MKKNITEINIDDYIRNQKRKGIKILRWGKKEWGILKKFVKAATTPLDEYGVTLGSGYILKEGNTFMGIKHEQRNQYAPDE